MNGLPIDSVGGFNFLYNFGGGNSGFGGNVGGPSASSSSFTESGGFVDVTGDVTLLPTDNFVLDMHVMTPLPDTAMIFSGGGVGLDTNGNPIGVLQVVLNAGRWEALVTNGRFNFSGIEIGSAQAQINVPTELTVAETNGWFTFLTNLVSCGPAKYLAPVFSGFSSSIHIAVAPGGGGLLYANISDVSIATFSPPPIQTAQANVSIKPAVENNVLTHSNQLYQLQVLRELGSTNWASLGLPIAGTGTNYSFFDSADLPYLFYRVQTY